MTLVKRTWYPYFILTVLSLTLLLIPSIRTTASTSPGGRSLQTLNLIAQETRLLQSELAKLQTENCEESYRRNRCQDLSESEMLLKEVRGELVSLSESESHATPDDLAWMRTRIVEVEQTLRTIELSGRD